jgi:hypothetical protein
MTVRDPRGVVHALRLSRGTRTSVSDIRSPPQPGGHATALYVPIQIHQRVDGVAAAVRQTPAVCAVRADSGRSRSRREPIDPYDPLMTPDELRAIKCAAVEAWNAKDLDRFFGYFR